MSHQHEKQHQLLDIVGDVASAVASSPAANRLLGGWTLAITGLAALAKTTAGVMRDHDKPLEQVLKDIKLPPKLDTSWREDIDSEIREKPEKGP